MYKQTEGLRVSAPGYQASYHIKTPGPLKDGLDMYAVWKNGKRKKSCCLRSEKLILSLADSLSLVFLKNNNITYLTKLWKFKG